MTPTETRDDGTRGFEREALPHMDAVFRFALRLSGSPAEAEDLVQETFLKAFRSWSQYTPGTRCKSWLLTICRNVFLRSRERVRLHREILEREVVFNEASQEVVQPIWAMLPSSDPEGEFFNAIVGDVVLNAIDDLPEEYRSAVILSDVEGLSYAEIVEVMGVPVGTVKSRLFRARRHLQKVLFDYAVEMGYLDPASGSTA
jgi:RNA polymerase sigma-70 factor (ECF subfamily)